MQLNINRNRTLPGIRNTRICDIQSIELVGQPQIFDAAKVEQLASLLLESGNLATPLLLRRKNAWGYILVAGELEYQAALRAREIEPNFKDVAAYVLDGDMEQNMQQQRQISGYGATQHSPIAAEILSVAHPAPRQLAAQRAIYTVTPANPPAETKNLVGHDLADSHTVTKVDLSEVLDAINGLKIYLAGDLSSQLANDLGAQLTSLVQDLAQNLIEPKLAATAAVPVAQEHSPSDAVHGSSVKSHPTQATVQNAPAPKPPTVPAKISKPPVKSSPAALGSDLEAEIVDYFNAQPITKIFLQSLTVGEKASRKIQASVPEQRQIKLFTDGADLQQRIPEIGPVIWEKIQHHWHDVVPASLTATANPALTSQGSAYSAASLDADDHDASDDEELAETITETITEILTESIIEPEPPQITVEIPAESVIEDIPHHLQRFNQLLTTGEGLYQLLMELKNIGFTHKIAQKFIEAAQPHAPFSSFAELERVAGLNATNWRYLVTAWS